MIWHCTHHTTWSTDMREIRIHQLSLLKVILLWVFLECVHDKVKHHYYLVVIRVIYIFHCNTTNTAIYSLYQFEQVSKFIMKHFILCKLVRFSYVSTQFNLVQDVSGIQSRLLYISISAALLIVLALPFCHLSITGKIKMAGGHPSSFFH